MRSSLGRIILALLPSIVGGFGPLAAQIEPGSLGSQSLSGYGPLFFVYAIAWALVLMWIILVARRLRVVERRLEE